MNSARKNKTKHTSSKRMTAEEFRNKIKLKNFETAARNARNHPHVQKIFKDRNLDPGKLRQHSSKIIGTGLVAGSLMLASPVLADNLPSSDDLLEKSKKQIHVSDAGEVSKGDVLVESFKSLLPENIRPLERREEKVLEKIIQEVTGVNAKATLEGEHLNTTYGKIGLEQHLRRYPGDVNGNHSDDPAILRADMAPGLGAWGYFAPSKSAMTPELEETEKWYAVVQTLYLHDWNTRQPYLKDWYKYRKVLIVNTENGKSVVASIADSGPAAFTGKSFGGSPEVMNHLGGPRYTKGPVILFFVDDPNNEVPLGPVNY